MFIEFVLLWGYRFTLIFLFVNIKIMSCALSSNLITVILDSCCTFALQCLQERVQTPCKILVMRIKMQMK